MSLSLYRLPPYKTSFSVCSFFRVPASRKNVMAKCFNIVIVLMCLLSV